jgi:site-specific DNA recombinase
VCWRAQQQGWDACKTKSIAAQPIEDSVLDRVRAIAQYESIIRKVFEHAVEQSAAEAGASKQERKALTAELKKLNQQLARVAAAGSQCRDGDLAELQERILTAERRLAQTGTCSANTEPNDPDVRAALQHFTPVWEELTTRERALIVRAAIERISYDGVTGQVSVVYTTPDIRHMCEGDERRAIA